MTPRTSIDLVSLPYPFLSSLHPEVSCGFWLYACFFLLLGPQSLVTIYRNGTGADVRINQWVLAALLLTDESQLAKCQQAPPA